VDLGEKGEILVKKREFGRKRGLSQRIKVIWDSLRND